MIPVLALLLRLLLIPNAGFEADISFWKSWGLATVDKGIVEGIKLTNNNYPTPFAYILGGMVKIYSLFKNPHNFNEFWTNNNLLFLTIAKLPAILADFGIAAIILLIGKNAKRFGFPALPLSFYLLLTLYYLFNPVSLIDGAWWGQVDSLGVFIFLLAFLLSLLRRPFWAGAVFMLAVMTKLQNMIYGPLFFLFVGQLTGPAGLVRAAAGSLVAFLGLNIEFFLSRNMDLVINSLTQNYDYFPFLSLNAFNFWWIASGGAGMQISDKITFAGLVNAKTFGLIIFSASYLLGILHLFTARTKTRAFLESLIVVGSAFFLFQTQAHDRYAFPLTVFLLLWSPFIIKRFKIFSLFYFIFTIFYFYNLHTALVLNYPQNGLPVLNQLIGSNFTLATSWVLLALFALFVLVFVRFWPVALITIIGTLGFLNLPLFKKEPVSLTKFTPLVSRQDWGSRQTNRTINSRLSVQYSFFKQGVNTHANSTNVYDLNQLFNRFSTHYGIDTEAGSSGTAVFEIWGDDRLLFRSGVISRFELPRYTEVEIKGVKLLKLITTDADDGIIDDHTDWLNPQLWP